MYSKDTLPVDLPKTGHLHFHKNGYVYWERACKWDKKKNQPAAGRMLIGKLCSDDKTKLIPNKKYFEVFPKAQHEQEKSIEAVAPLPKQGRLSFTMNFGGYCALKEVALKTGLYDALKANFPGQADKIIALAMHSIMSGNSTAQDFPFWAFENYCGLERPLTDTEVSDLFRSIGMNSESRYDFYYDFRENYFTSGIPSSDTLMVAGDSTNQNTYSKGNELASYGKSKVKEGLPCINTFCLADLETGIPVYSEVYTGSLLDMVQSSITVDTLNDLGYQKLYTFLDRGYVSEKNLKKLSDMDYDFSVMMPERISKVVDTLAENHFIKDNIKYYIESENAYGIHLGKIDILDQKLNAYVYYDPVRAEQERSTITTKLSVMRDTILQRKRLTKRLEEQFGDWFTFTKIDNPAKGERNFDFKLKIDVIQKEMDDAGFFMVCSRTDTPVDETLINIRKRDVVEKVFNRLKSHLGMEKTYTHSKATYEGKMFVAFVALIMAQGFEWFTKNFKGKKTSDTLHTKLSSLNQCQIHRTHDRKGWLLCYAMTRKNKSILEPIGLTEEAVKRQVLAL